MSIIFQKLKDLGNRSSEQKGLQPPKLLHGNNIYTFRRMFFSPIGALLIFSTISAFGIISFYSLSFLKDYLDSGSSKAIVIQHQQTDILPTDLSPTGDPLAPPPEPPSLSTADTVLVPEEPSSTRKPKDFKIPEYFIHQTKEVKGNESLEIPDAPEHIPEDSRDQFLPSSKSVYNIPSKKMPVFGHLSPSTGAENLKPEVKTQLREDDHTTSAIDLPQRQRSVNPEETLESEKSKSPVASSNSRRTTFLEEKKEVQEAAIRVAKQRRTQKTSAIASLAADLEHAIEINDTVRTEELLSRLALIKNVNSSYFLKLKAFKEIREENYDLAKRLLDKVLAKDKTDFEAGINMAIIEIRKQESANAKQRLIRLKELYPFQSAIDDLLNLL